MTPPPGYQAYGVPGANPQPLKKATTTMVLGIIGLFCIPFVFSVLALVLGLQAHGEIDRSGGMYRNRGMATAAASSTSSAAPSPAAPSTPPARVRWWCLAAAATSSMA